MKKQKINWLLYAILGLLSIGIIAASLWAKESTEWFTILSGVGCGSFASVAIAFLLELANVIQKERKNVSIFESYFSGLYFNFAMLLSSLSIVYGKEKRNTAGELHWFDWLERISEEPSVKNSPSKKEFIIEKIQDVEKEIARIEENKLLLLGQDLIDDTEIVALTNIRVDLSVVEFELKDSQTNWSDIKSILPELKEHIEESEILRKFNHVTYNEGLKKLLFTRCYLNGGDKDASN